MSETRDPETDQQAPVPTDEPGAHEVLIESFNAVINRTSIVKAGASEEGQQLAELSIAAYQRLQEDLREREAMGLKKYGTKLQASNGRDNLRDLYEELLDALAYTSNAASRLSALSKKQQAETITEAESLEGDNLHAVIYGDLDLMVTLADIAVQIAHVFNEAEGGEPTA